MVDLASRHTATRPRTIDELVSEIKSVHPELDATAAEAEEIGTAPVALIDVMRRIRVPMIKAPHEVGGDLLLLADQCRYFTALSYSNPTAAWTGFNHAGAAGMAGARLTDSGLHHVFGTDPSPFMAAVSAPTGNFSRVDGGVLVNGTWNYASGVRHADWAMVTALEKSHDPDKPTVRMCVLNIADADVTGEWDVMALKGTGSVSVVARDAFVPDALVIDPRDQPLRGGPMFSLNYQPYVAGENLGFTFGVCTRFLDEMVTYARTKTRGADGGLANRGAFQYELGRSSQQVAAAIAHATTALEQMDDAFMSNGRLTSREERATVAMLTYCTESAVDAVTRLMSFAGAGALFSISPLQRCFRDAHGSAQHLVASNVSYDRYAQTLLSDESAIV